VLQRDNKVFVRDFESINGTFVNDEQVKGEIELHDSDRLKMGPLLFQVKIEVAAPENRPPVASKNLATKPAAKSNTPASSVDPKASSPTAVARKPEQAASSAATDTQTDDLAAQAEAQTETSAEGGGTSNDESIAAMLLSLCDDSSDGPFSVGSEYLEGSTVHEMSPPPELAAQLAQEREHLAAQLAQEKSAKEFRESLRGRMR
jgi:pSer/pThr/pTyr-binding forkhead associated (FHA) protein